MAERFLLLLSFASRFDADAPKCPTFLVIDKSQTRPAKLYCSEVQCSGVGLQKMLNCCRDPNDGYLPVWPRYSVSARRRLELARPHNFIAPTTSVTFGVPSTNSYYRPTPNDSDFVCVRQSRNKTKVSLQCFWKQSACLRISLICSHKTIDVYAYSVGNGHYTVYRPWKNWRTTKVQEMTG